MVKKQFKDMTYWNIPLNPRLLATVWASPFSSEAHWTPRLVPSLSSLYIYSMLLRYVLHKVQNFAKENVIFATRPLLFLFVSNVLAPPYSVFKNQD